ncbi:uncharacterized protein LOC124151335 [Haliotis rufescens]|uniref:uncharacterized protein LOC124151335 n=1 Tax=Haliotis rufescens TaxID=6454 RepID=UPI00201F4973|nr:uncharacterized protein LOC124151335 [Haliotis rufescens]XP_046379699.2 uncharacterized protein LOC124151335 [Haliotis rufescens]XP_048242327.1 uncharacterized protein LOC124151335 [Haliotis rufescens]
MDKEYHAFLCFNGADEEFVDKLREYLESPNIGLKCVDHRRDFHAGKPVVKNIEEFIARSRKCVLIMTPDFVTSEWCAFETDIMVNMSVEETRENIIPVLVKPCNIPKGVRTLTYIDVRQSQRWRERLVDAIRRTSKTVPCTDRSTPETEVGEPDMEDTVRTARDEKQMYLQCVQDYKQDKRKLELEGKSLETEVNNAFTLISKQLFDQLEKQKAKRLEEIRTQIANRQTTLLQQRNTADDIVRLMEADFKNNTQNLKHFIGKLDDYASLLKEQRGGSYYGFVDYGSQVEKINELMSTVGHLRETDITQLRSQEDKDNFLKEMHPSLAILPQATEINIHSIVRCPYFQYDAKTVSEDCRILPDGSLSNQPPLQPHSPSDTRLKTYRGAAGTRTLTAGGVYYWENKLDVDLEKELDGRDSVFEVALSRDGVFDDSHEGHAAGSVVSIRAYRCVRHQGVCLSTARYASLVYHGFLTQNRRGKWPAIELGFLLDTVRQRLTVYDVTKKWEITSVEGNGDVEEFTPQFAVYAPKNGSVKLSVITGIGLHVSDETSKRLMKDIEKLNQ